MSYVEKYYFSQLQGTSKKALSQQYFSGSLAPSNKAELRLVIGEEGELASGAWIRFYLYVDIEDGVIGDAKFVAFGNTLLMLTGEILCKMILRKNYDQAQRIGADLILKEMDLQGSLGEEVFSIVNFALFALESALNQCLDIELSQEYLRTPLSLDLTKIENIDWPSLDLEEKKRTVQGVIQQEIQPYVSLDEGKVELYDISEEDLVTVVYSGNCTSCSAATGSTLSAIQQILRAKLSPTIQVRPK